MNLLLYIFVLPLVAFSSICSFNFAEAIDPKVVATHNFTLGHNPSVSANPLSGDLFAVYTQTKNNVTNIYFTKSSDNGSSFSTPIMINDKPGDAADTWNTIPIRFGSNNEIYVTWMVSKDHPDFPWGITELRISKSLDNGSTFSSAINPLMNYPSEKAFFDLSVSGNNTLYLSFLDSQTNESGTKVIGYPSSFKMVKSSNGGISFSNPITLDKQNCVCCQTASAIGPDGEVYFAWRDLQYEKDSKPVDPQNPYNFGYGNGSLLEDFDYDDYETIRDIVVMHTTDNGLGKTFSPPSKVSNDKWYMNACPDAGPGMAFDKTGRLHIAWFTGSNTTDHGLGYYYAYSDDQGRTFSPPIPILTDKEFIPPTQVSLGVDKDNNVWIAFADQRSSAIKRYSTIDDDHLGRIHLAVLDKNHQKLFSGPIAFGKINEIVDLAMGDDRYYLAYRDGNEAKIAIVTAS